MNVDELTKEDFLGKTEIYEALYDLKNNTFEFNRLKARLTDRARVLKITNFGGTYKAFEKEHNKMYGENITEFTNQPLELLSGNWVCDDYGITIVMDGTEKVACNHPIMPIERLVNVDTGVEKLKIAFSKGKRWRSVTAERKTLSSNNGILELANSGVAITSDSAKLLVKYLYDIEEKNYENIPEHNSVSRLGWIGEDTFAPYVEDLVFEGDDGYTNMFKAVNQKGSFSKWIEEAKKCRAENVIVKIMIAASFSSVLVKKVDALSFFVHLWGEASGTGKTVALMLAASVWANPASGEYVRTFNATKVGNEQLAGFCNSLPLILDEFQLKQKRGDFEEIVYMLTEGIGKTRGAMRGGIQRTLTWKNCILTSGETPITQEVTGAGAFNRIVELHVKDALFSNHSKTLEIIRKNYGWAGKALVEHLIQDDNMAQCKELYKDLYKQVLETDTTEKQAMAAAAILTADNLITDCFFNGENPLTIDELGVHLHTKDEVDINKRAYDYLKGAIEINHNRFDPGNENGEIWGKAENNHIYIIRPAFDKMLSEEGYSSKALLSWLMKKDLIETEPPNKGRRSPKPTISTRIKGTPVRCVALKIEEIDAEQEDFDLIP